MQKDVFEIEGADLGQLTKLVVSLDGAGLRPAWNLDHVLVGDDSPEWCMASPTALNRSY